jgi:hypothetical protein
MPAVQAPPGDNTMVRIATLVIFTLLQSGVVCAGELPTVADVLGKFVEAVGDEETGLLNHVGYHNDLGDWRAVNGVKHPHRWAFGHKGGHTTYISEKIVVSKAP